MFLVFDEITLEKINLEKSTSNLENTLENFSNTAQNGFGTLKILEIRRHILISTLKKGPKIGACSAMNLLLKINIRPTDR